MATDIQEHKGTAGENPWYARWTGLIDEVQTELNARLEKSSPDPLIFTLPTNQLKAAQGADVIHHLDIEFPDVSTAACDVRLFRATNTSGARSLFIHKGDGTSAVAIQLDAVNERILVSGNVVFHTGNLASSQEAWITPTLLNSWANAGGFTTQYFKDHQGMVHIQGRVTGGTIGASAFTLPSGYRPSQTQVFAADANGAFGRLSITTAGAVVPEIGSNANFSLACPPFRVA